MSLVERCDECGRLLGPRRFSRVACQCPILPPDDPDRPPWPLPLNPPKSEEPKGDG